MEFKLNPQDNMQSALNLLVQSFEQLQDQLEKTHIGEDIPEDHVISEEAAEKIDNDFFTSVTSCIENSIEQNNIEPLDLAAVISILADALEETAPEIFQDSEFSEEVVE